MGKPGGADLQLGLATGPALFAWEEHPGMGPLIRRKFEQDGDVELVSSPLPLFKSITHHCLSRQETTSGDPLVLNARGISHGLMPIKQGR
jgi:geranylgeranyl pyrophosphate synthase